MSSVTARAHVSASNGTCIAVGDQSIAKMYKTHYSSDKMNIDTYMNYLSEDEATNLYNAIVGNPIHLKHSNITKKGEISKKRNKTIYGSLETYSYTYRGVESKTPIIHWSKFPELEKLSQRIQETTKQPYNTCVIQIYNSGVVEIKPHRDKEMKKGSIIASISLGETRNMRFERSSYDDVEIPLQSGTLCLLNPPTNDYWLHSIPPDSSTSYRISLVFRNF